MALSMRCVRANKIGDEYIITIDFFDDTDPETTTIETRDISGMNRTQIENRLNQMFIKAKTLYDQQAQLTTLANQIVAKVLAGEVETE